MKRVPTADVLCVAVPARVDPGDPRQLALILSALDDVAMESVRRQWRGGSGPEIQDFTTDWMVTKDPAVLETFQPAHDCAACRAGNDQAKTFLRENPGRWVAAANVSYTEVWPA